MPYVVSHVSWKLYSDFFHESFFFGSNVLNIRFSQTFIHLFILNCSWMT